MSLSNTHTPSEQRAVDRSPGHTYNKIHDKSHTYVVSTDIHTMCSTHTHCNCHFQDFSETDTKKYCQQRTTIHKLTTLQDRFPVICLHLDPLLILKSREMILTSRLKETSRWRSCRFFLFSFAFSRTCFILLPLLRPHSSCDVEFRPNF